MSEHNINKLYEQLARAEAERDAWRGKSSEHYKMAGLLVESLRKQLRVAEENRTGDET